MALRQLGSNAVRDAIKNSGLPLEEGEIGILTEYVLHKVAAAIKDQHSLTFDRMTLRKALDLAREGSW